MTSDDLIGYLGRSVNLSHYTAYLPTAIDSFATLVSVVDYQSARQSSPSNWPHWVSVTFFSGTNQSTSSLYAGLRMGDNYTHYIPISVITAESFSPPTATTTTVTLTGLTANDKSRLEQLLTRAGFTSFSIN